MIVIEDAEKERDTRNQDALQATHIWQKVQYRVPTSLDQSLIQIHLKLNPLDQAFLRQNWHRTSFFQSKHTRILQLSDLIQINGQILQG